MAFGKLSEKIRNWLYGNNDEIMKSEGQQIAKTYLYGNITDNTYRFQKRRSKALNEMFGAGKNK